MSNQISHNKIRKELNRKIDDPKVVDRIIYMFWDLDAYQSIISIKRFFELLLKYIDSKGTDFTRYEIYQYFLSEISPDHLEKLKKIAVSLELLQQNDLEIDDMNKLLGKLSITDQEIIDEIFNSEITCISSDKKFSFIHHTIQEYLASQFILESSDSIKKFNEFLILEQESLVAIKPSWYGVIRFLAESEEGDDILTRIIEIIEEHPDNIDENFADSICSVTKGTIQEEKSKVLFESITSAYKNKAIWLPTWASKNIWRLVTEDQLADIKQEFEKEVTTLRDAVIIGNYISILEGLIKNRFDWIEPDIEFYRTKLIELAHEEKGYGVVQRRSFDALEYGVGDENLLEAVSDTISSKDQLVREALLDFASTILPNSPKTIDLLIQGFKKDNAIHARHGLYQITTVEGLLYFLDKLVDDETFRDEFLDGESIFSAKEKKGDEKLIKLLKKFQRKEEILKTLKELIIVSYGSPDKYYSHRGSPFLTEVTKIIHVENKDFGLELISRIPEGSSLYNYIAPFTLLISLDNFDKLVPKLFEIADDKDWTVRNILYTTANRDEEGESIFKKAIKEGLIEKPKEQKVEKRPSKYKELKNLLEPTKGKFNPNVFRYFCENYEELKEEITDIETSRLKNLIIGTVLEKWDPKTIEVTIQDKDSKAGTRSHSITSWAPIFGDALRTASLLGLQDEIQEYREEIINYIPFAYSQEEQAIKDIVSKAEEEELQYVNSVFLDQDKDIRYYLPSTYTYIVPQLLEETSDSSSKQVYLSFIEDENIEGYVRIQAIEKLENCLEKDDEKYLIGLFDKYLSSEDEKEVEIAEKANELLISHFANEEAIKWRFDQIKERAKPFKEPDDVHEVSSFEEEFHSMKFASVLFQNLDSQYLDKITDLLIHSFELSDKHRSYINYLWRIVISYFKKIAREGSFAPYNHLVQILKDYSTTNTNTSNWFSSRLEEIRNYYIDTIGKVNLDTFKEFKNGTRKN